MRVTGGTARGRRLAAPRGERVRPTSDKVKEALFSILTSLLGNLEGLRILDIFAGTGNLGIEALSRGCSEAVFIDNHRESVSVIRQNLTQLNLADRSRVVTREATAAVQLLAGESPFQIIVLDPPYRQGLTEKILHLLESAPYVTMETIIVAESDSNEVFAEKFGPLKQFDRRMYGDTALTFFKKGIPDDHA